MDTPVKMRVKIFLLTMSVRQKEVKFFLLTMRLHPSTRLRETVSLSDEQIKNISRCGILKKSRRRNLNFSV